MQLQIRLKDNKLFPKNDCREAHMTIGDQHPAYLKLKQGYDFDIDWETGISVKETRGGFDLDSFEKKSIADTATLKEMRDYLSTQL